MGPGGLLDVGRGMDVGRSLHVNGELVRDIGWATAQTLRDLGIAAAVSFVAALTIGAGLYRARRAASGWVARLLRHVGATVFAGYLLPFIVVLVLVLALVAKPASWPGVSGGESVPVVVVLIVAGVLFGVRVIEQELARVDPAAVGSIEAMGASTWRVWSTLMSEAAPGLVRGLAATLRWLLACAAVLGVIADDGLGGLLARLVASAAPTQATVLAASVLGALVLGVHGLGAGAVRALRPRVRAEGG